MLYRLGQSLNIEKRWKQHCNDRYFKCSALRSAIDKYGKDNMSFEILQEHPRIKMILNSYEIY